MSEFKGRHFEGEIVLWAVRWYCRDGVSYRDLEQMLGERGEWAYLYWAVDKHSDTICIGPWTSTATPLSSTFRRRATRPRPIASSARRFGA